jgi:plasmid stability protein
MASITIRRLDERTKARLRVRAALHGRSMEEEARTLLRSALRDDVASPGNLADAIGARFRRLGGVELRIPVRGPIREPPRSSR